MTRRRPTAQLDDAERSRLAIYVRARREAAGGDGPPLLRRIGADAIGDSLAIESPALAAAVAWFENRLPIED
ncbi:MAG TPA: hypothetical protein VHB99_04895 [Pirellulales bacterium]|nr:hypothetical protein [Pirellulales bacterium]